MWTNEQIDVIIFPKAAICLTANAPKSYVHNGMSGKRGLIVHLAIRIVGDHDQVDQEPPIHIYLKM